MIGFVLDNVLRAVFSFGLVLADENKFLFIFELDLIVIVEFPILEKFFPIGLDGQYSFLVILWELGMKIANDLDFHIGEDVFVERVIVISGIDIKESLLIGSVLELD